MLIYKILYQWQPKYLSQSDISLRRCVISHIDEVSSQIIRFKDSNANQILQQFQDNKVVLFPIEYK
ncbi:unnamed protein product [Paramecium primaurelia]|uniref:Uncharacterized protein n=1 Tax=Paramecium primaurelia TaxID=5886 RepID=A0A8S1PQ56_PARPR|nr:unnamed protein product [Paramecium primaurelia]